jgi:hypothetical protein
MQGVTVHQANRDGLRPLLDVCRKGDSLETVRARLYERIATREVSTADARLLDHLWASALAQMAIDNPGYRRR